MSSRLRIKLPPCATCTGTQLIFPPFLCDQTDIFILIRCWKIFELSVSSKFLNFYVSSFSLRGKLIEINCKFSYVGELDFELELIPKIYTDPPLRMIMNVFRSLLQFAAN